MALSDNSLKTLTMHGQQRAAVIPLSMRKTELRSLATNKSVSLDTLWRERTAVILLLRDFASQACRLGALKINGIRSLLEAHDISVFVIGMEEVGAHEFVVREFFGGDTYAIDKTIKFDPLAILSSLFLSKEPHEDKPDIKLTDYEYGGVLVVCKDGDTVLLNHRQSSLADHISNHTILKTLGIPRSGGINKS